MTDFKPGDHVVYQHTALGTTLHNGQTGVIEEVFDRYGEPYAKVKWDDFAGSAPSHPYLHNLVLTFRPAAYAAQAADLRRRAADLRNERDEKYAEADRLRDEAEAASDLAYKYDRAAQGLDLLEDIK